MTPRPWCNLDYWSPAEVKRLNVADIPVELYDDGSSLAVRCYPYGNAIVALQLRTPTVILHADLTVRQATALALAIVQASIRHGRGPWAKD